MHGAPILVQFKARIKDNKGAYQRRGRAASRDHRPHAHHLLGETIYWFQGGGTLWKVLDLKNGFDPSQAAEVQLSSSGFVIPHWNGCCWNRLVSKLRTIWRKLQNISCLSRKNAKFQRRHFLEESTGKNNFELSGNHWWPIQHFVVKHKTWGEDPNQPRANFFEFLSLSKSWIRARH